VIEVQLIPDVELGNCARRRAHDEGVWDFNLHIAKLLDTVRWCKSQLVDLIVSVGVETVSSASSSGRGSPSRVCPTC
jgi:hypothetical protein